MSTLGNENICRFYVAVHDALAVSYIQRIRNFDPYLQQLLHLQGPSADQVFQGLPLHVLHDDESIPVQLVNFVDGTDVGMIQRRRSFCLEPKTTQCLRIFRNIIGQEF